MIELFDYSAEMAVIGGILISNAKAVEVCEILTSTDFYAIETKIIFSAIESLHEQNKPIDPVTVSSALSENDDLARVGGLQYLAETAHNTPSAANIMSYAHIVRDNSKSRHVDAQAVLIREAIHSTEGDTQDKINNAISLASNIGGDDATDSERSFADVQAAMIRVMEWRIKNKGGLTGQSMGFDNLDKRFNGFNDTDLLIVAGRPAMGKTTFGLNLTQAAAKNKHSVVFSMEMSAEQITEKLWSSYGLPMNAIKTGKFDEEHFPLLSKGVRLTKDLKLTVDDRGGLTPQQIRAKCLKLKREHGELGVVMIDYIQLMNVNNSTGQTDKVTQISGALKALAKELRCPVIALSQLNRGVEQRPNKRPVMSDLRDSGAIEQDADIIMFCYRDDYYADMEGRDSEAKGIAEIITAKFRGGEVGTDYLRAELHCSRFTNIINQDGY